MIRITLTAIFTASLMLNLFTFLPECFQRPSRPIMTAENLPQNPEFDKLVTRLNQLPTKAVR